MKNSDMPSSPTNYMQFTNSHGGCDELYSDNKGLTKREYFAAKALEGLCFCSRGYIEGWEDKIARDALRVADRLLELMEGEDE